jgi:hypothetical protein
MADVEELQWREAMVEAVKKYAQEHYDEGWDVVVEAYDDAEILGVILGGGDRVIGEETAIEEMRNIVSLYKEKAANQGFDEAQLELEQGRRDMIVDALACEAEANYDDREAQADYDDKNPPMHQSY